MELRNGLEMLAVFSSWSSTRKDNRRNFVSTPKIDNLKSRLCANGTIPSTSVHFGLSAGGGELEMAMRSSPQASAFSFRKMNRSRGALFGSSMMKVVSPFFSAQLIVF